MGILSGLVTRRMAARPPRFLQQRTYCTLRRFDQYSGTLGRWMSALRIGSADAARMHITFANDYVDLIIASYRCRSAARAPKRFPRASRPCHDAGCRRPALPDSLRDFRPAERRRQDGRKWIRNGVLEATGQDARRGDALGDRTARDRRPSEYDARRRIGVSRWRPGYSGLARDHACGRHADGNWRSR